MVQFNDFLITLDGYLSGSWWFPILLVGTGILASGPVTWCCGEATNVFIDSLRISEVCVRKVFNTCNSELRQTGEFPCKVSVVAAVR